MRQSLISDQNGACSLARENLSLRSIEYKLIA